MGSEKYPELKNLLSGPFFQCWAEVDKRSANQILNEAIIEYKASQGLEIFHEIDSIISSNFSEEELVKILGYDIGCNYDPRQDGIAIKQWLSNLKKIIKNV